MSTLALGKYRIIRELARSNDIVYEATDPQMGRKIALKELQMPPNLVGRQRQERIQRFYREAKAAGRLNHPNVVTIHEVGEDNGRHFIAMEYLEGGSLRDRLRREGRLPLAEALRIAIAVADGLEYAHQHGVVHRDIKPDNVHLPPGGKVKITDFGIARLTFEPTLTAAGQIFGTPSYMSPEQVQGGAIDARSDVFSLGVMLYEMISGEKPFTGESVITITYNIMNREASPMAMAPKAVDSVLRRAMAKNPAHRYQSAGEFAQALRGLAGQRSAPSPGVAARPPAPRPAPPPPAPRPARPAIAPRQAIAPRAARTPMPAPAGAPIAPAAAPGPPAVAVPAPVYAAVPRAPRPSLLSEDQRYWINLLLVAVVIGVVLVGMILLGATAFDNWQKAQGLRQEWQSEDRSAAAVREGNSAEAYRQSSRAAQQSGGNARTRLINHWNAAVNALGKGSNLFANDDLDGAEEWFRKAIKSDPLMGDAYLGLGDVAGNRGNHPAAIQFYQQAEKTWMERLARGGLPKKIEETAISGKDRARERLAIAHWDYGQDLETQGRIPEARAEYELAAKADFNSAAGGFARSRLDDLNRAFR